MVACHTQATVPRNHPYRQELTVNVGGKTARQRIASFP
jgi:hypothetical protein